LAGTRGRREDAGNNPREQSYSHGIHPSLTRKGHGEFQLYKLASRVLGRWKYQSHENSATKGLVYADNESVEESKTEQPGSSLEYENPGRASMKKHIPLQNGLWM